MDAGLESIVVAETKLSDVNGLEGRLVIAGYDLDDLVPQTTFEGVIALLWSGLFEVSINDASVREKLGRARVAAFEAIAGLPTVNAIETLRMGICCVPDEEGFDSAVSLVATIGVATAIAARRTQGQALIAPNPLVSHSEDILTMMRGHRPTPEQVKALDTYLVTVSDHGLNASTFAARVVASTRAGLTSATLAGVSALKGPLHGGAPGPVLDMLDAIGAPGNALDWIETAMGRGERLMGFGHRVYRVRDPRADALKHAVADLPAASGRLNFAAVIEDVALKELAKRYPTRKLDTNVEFYTALLLEALEFPRDVFTCVFASGRIAGWVAHSKEQIATNRLIRPMSVYVGELGKVAA